MYAPMTTYPNEGQEAQPLQQNLPTCTTTPPAAPVLNTFRSIFRSPSSVESSSVGGGSSNLDTNTAVTYAQLVSPIATTQENERISVVKVGIPLHQMSTKDVQNQLHSLKSANSANNSPTTSRSPNHYNDQIRPKSPETNL